MKRGYFFAMAATVLVSSANAELANRIALPGFYVGGNIGYVTARVDEASTGRQACQGDPTCTIVGSSDDTGAFGWKLFGGYLFNQYIALEGGYFNLGEMSFDDTTNTGETFKGTASVQGFNADVVGHLPLMERLSLFGRLGVTYAEVNKDYSYSGGTFYVNGVPMDMHQDAWNVGVKAGVGMQYDFTPRFGVRGEWEGYHFEEDESRSGVDENFFSLGIVYRFGPEPEPERVEPAPVPAEPQVIEKVVEKEVIKEVPAAPVVVTMPPERVVLAADTLFDFDKAVVKPEGKAALKDLAARLQKGDELVVVGYTDSVGSEAYNQKLSMKRADAVKDELVAVGVAAERIKTEGRGESDPVAGNDTEIGRAQNRRVEIDIIAVQQEPFAVIQETGADETEAE